MIVLGLGCNIGDRIENLRKALNKIYLISKIKVLHVSPLYQSDALLPKNAPSDWNKSFLNVAIGIESKLNPEELLDKIKIIEFEMGRLRNHEKWSPRIIDIDILLWNNDCYNSKNLIIPHPELLNRPFVLWPLSDIVPNWRYNVPNSNFTNFCISELIKKFGSRFDGKSFLHTKQIAHRIDTPQIFGILNITDDSFSDGGKFLSTKLAYKHAKKMFIEGADVIDVGAISTRPGAKILSTEIEWNRLYPFLELWNSFWKNDNFKPKLSIDTNNPIILQKIISRYNIDFLNDVSGLTNLKIKKLVLEKKLNTIFMHNLGIPPSYNVIIKNDKDIIANLYKWCENHLDNLIKEGFEKKKLIFDVGIGFGKNWAQSLTIIKNIDKFNKLGVKIMVGHSCKSFMNVITSKIPSQRHLETAIFSGFLSTKNIDYLRVHSVDYTMRVLKLNEMIRCNI